MFHVYDRLRLGDVPRRYTVEAGKRLGDFWLPMDGGAYDLWVLGPNGFHRHFTGNALLAFATARPNPEVHVEGNPRGGDLLVRFFNGGNGAARFSLEMNRYVSARAETYDVVERSENVIRLPLERSKFWYDFTVRVANQPGFSRRFAGRLETGEPSISNPAMFGGAIGEQLKIG